MKEHAYALFDMDGTLVDSMPYWRSLHVAYAKHQKPDLTPEEIQRLESVFGYGEVIRLYQELQIPATLDGLVEYSEEKMAHYYRECVQPKPHVIAHLNALKAKGVKMGVITLTPHRGADLCLEVCGLDNYFSFVLTREDTPKHTGKEDPKIFKMAMRLLGCRKASECAFYEDSVYAMETARKMGFYICAVEDRFSERELAKVSSLADEVLNFGYHLPLDGKILE